MAEPSAPAKPRQGTRCPRRNRTGREPQESEHPPHLAENMEAKTVEPSTPTKPRQGTRCPRRNKRGGEPQESEHPPQQSENMEAETDVKKAEPSAPANPPQETISVRSRRGCRANLDMQEPPQLPPTETGPASQGRKKSVEDGASKEEAVAGRPRGRSRRTVTNSAEALPTEEQVDEKPRRRLRGKMAATGGGKTAVRAPRRAGALSTHQGSDEVFPAEVPEPAPPARRAARAAVSKEKEPGTQPVDTVLAERATRRGLRSRHVPSPLGPPEMANAGKIPRETVKESGARTRQRPGRAAPPNPPLPTIREEASGDKDYGDTKLPDHSAPGDMQHGGSRARLKLHTEPAGSTGGAPSTEHPGEATGVPAKAGRTQKGAAAGAAPRRRVKAPLTTATTHESVPTPTPSPESAPPEKRAKKSTDDEVTRPAPRSSRLKPRNPPGPEAEPDGEERPATKPSQTQSGVSSRQRAAARSSKRRVPAEAATPSPEQENATPPKRMRTRRMLS
ncbi:serine/arginine repetitive matrix protein 1-like [Echinops telfairi]|uniref:Serine/arginine repetitive matrix protein 1-like n=1 Tax=Echinops telfairi TaxID=9371 RepID=A0AC55D735_ECHTE|nr:serine/arginine repetitive matrix protein 1-like [Echinops telfairi]